MTEKRVNSNRIATRIDELSYCSEPTAGGVTRLSFTKEFQMAQKLVEQWMNEAGMTVRRDDLNNLIGRYEGKNPHAPVILIGSHLDTVIEGGKYDGMSGIVAGIEIVAVLHNSGIVLENPIEVIAFCDEEGVRFHSTFLGSKAIAGTLTEEELQVVDENGISIASAIRNIGLNPLNYKNAARDSKDVLAYLELHIEQGPVLEEEGVACGVVTGIAGASRYSFRIEGFAGHAGTVPVALRKDALAGTSELILEIERLAKEYAPIVATVGKLTVNPGSSNVIPGEVIGTLDIRDTNEQRKNEVLKQIFQSCEEICTRRGLQCHFDKVMEAAPILCSDSIISVIESAIQKNNMRVIRLISGAGHDAMAMADLTKIGMIFVRCTKGISHHPDEHAIPADLGLGAEVLLDTVLQLTKNETIVKEKI
ncbi:allantoate amidohydrolase [Scopulibacillus cellulosilyticus]|uniref:Allantoate amidohydrolase n=1 Tax=Scopulibacillus cellulosilyticus TaxID=2665665 RepID=A0ABW2Q0R4_9BACL